MCIRDRAEPDDHRAGRPTEPPGVRLGAQSSGVRGADRPRSVSYTHLRAHETVLDLVCRLLLEKKKVLTQDVPTTL